MTRAASTRFHFGEAVVLNGRPMLSRIWSFLWQRKKYWLLPLVVVLVVFGVLIFVARQNAVGPFQYNMF